MYDFVARIQSYFVQIPIRITSSKPGGLSMNGSSLNVNLMFDQNDVFLQTGLCKSDTYVRISVLYVILTST